MLHLIPVEGNGPVRGVIANGRGNGEALWQLGIDADLTNPLGGELSGDALKKNCYFNSRVVIENFPLFRVIKGQGAEDLVTGTVTASGTIENPYLSLELARLSMKAGGNKLKASGTLAFVEGAFSIPGMSVDWGSISARNRPRFFIALRSFIIWIVKACHHFRPYYHKNAVGTRLPIASIAAPAGFSP